MSPMMIDSYLRNRDFNGVFCGCLNNKLCDSVYNGEFLVTFPTQATILNWYVFGSNISATKSQKKKNLKLKTSITLVTFFHQLRKI